MSSTAVVTCYALLEIVAGFLLFTVLLRGYSVPLVALGFFGFALTQSVIWFGSWLIVAVVCHALSYLFDGKGPFRRTFTLVGWGYLPLIAGSFVSVIVNIMIAQGAPSATLQSPEQAVAAVEQLSSGPATQMANLVSSVLYIWTAYI